MCAVSNVGDYWKQGFPDRYPGWVEPYNPPQVTKQEFDALKKEMEELKKLLKAAKKYDEAMGESDCEMDEKVALIKKFADLVGVNMDEIFGKKK